MDQTRRKILGSIGGVSIVSIAGCFGLGDDGTGNESDSESQSGVTGTPSDEELPEGTAEHMAYLPSREGEPRHPPYYTGDSPFDAESVELTISTVESMDDKFAEGEFNEKTVFYEPREYIHFAVDYWETVFPGLSVTVEIPRIGEDPHPDADIRVHWRDFEAIFDARPDHEVYGQGITDQDQPLAYRDNPSETLATTNVVDVTVNAHQPPAMYKHGLITALGAAFGIEYEETGIMNPWFLFEPAVGRATIREWRETGLHDERRDIVDLALDARRELLRGEFEAAATLCEEGKERIEAFDRDVEPIINIVVDDGVEYGELALRETQYFFNTDMWDVFDHVEQQAEQEEPSYQEIGDGEAPILHAFRHKIFDSIQPYRSITAGYYEMVVDEPLDLRVGIPFDPDNYDYYSSYDEY